MATAATEETAAAEEAAAALLRLARGCSILRPQTATPSAAVSLVALPVRQNHAEPRKQRGSTARGSPPRLAPRCVSTWPSKRARRAKCEIYIDARGVRVAKV